MANLYERIAKDLPSSPGFPAYVNLFQSQDKTRAAYTAHMDHPTDSALAAALRDCLDKEQNCCILSKMEASGPPIQPETT